MRRCGNVKRDDDVSGCEASLYDRVASRVHPLAGCRGAAAGTERSEGKGRFGGILNTVTSRRTGVRGCTEQERKRKRRDRDVSGCEASLYDRVASRVHPLAGCRGAAAGTERSEGKGRFGGILNTVTSRRTGVRGCTEQERKRKRRDNNVSGCEASLLQREVWRDFKYCYISSHRRSGMYGAGTET